MLSVNIGGQGGMMPSVRKNMLETGIVGGLLFTIHVSVPNCGAWPWIWPVFAGATSVWRATHEPQPHRWRAGLVAALGTGIVTGAIAFVGVATVVYVVVHTGIVPVLRPTGTAFPAAGIGGIAALFLAATDVVVAFLGGMLMLPTRYFQIRHAEAGTGRGSGQRAV